MDEIFAYCLPLEIWIIIFEYLSVRDRLVMRLVCRDWRNIVSLQRFSNAYTLRINPGNLPYIRQFLEQGEYHNSLITCAERFKIQCQPMSDNLDYLFRKIGGNIRWLKLYCNIADLKLVQRHCHRLEALIVRYEDFDEYMNVDLSAFEKLEVLDFYKIFPEKLAYFRNTDVTLFTVLLSPNVPFQLNTLSFEWESAIEGKGLLDVLHKHSDKLKNLSITFRENVTLPIVDHPNWQQTIKELRNLKQLSLVRYVGRRINEIVEAFSDSPIEKLEVPMAMNYTNLTLSLTVQQWRDTLQYLDLKYCCHLTDDGMSVLYELRHILRVLKLGYSERITHQALLNGIAKETNDQLRKFEYSFNSSTTGEGLKSPLFNLPKLTHLDLGHCMQALCDVLATAIFNNLIHLRHLNLAYGSMITDYSMIGSADSKGIWNLRNLEYLSMTGCRRITNASLRKAMRLNKLCYLDLSNIPYLNSKGFTELAKNCPSIETLILRGCPYMTEADAVYFNRNLKRLRQLNW